MFAPRNSSPIQLYNPEDVAAYQVCLLKSPEYIEIWIWAELVLRLRFYTEVEIDHMVQ